MDSTPIYLDNHATTRVDPRVVEAMVPYFDCHYGNAHSLTHWFGEQAREALESSRERIARCLGGRPEEIVFTSGATEANNLALQGIMRHPRMVRRHVVSVVTEHASVIDPLTRLEQQGVRLSWLGVRCWKERDAGRIDLEDLQQNLTEDTALVSVMWANNELGVIQPIDQIGAMTRQAGALLHCDATQAVGKLEIDVARVPIDLLSCSAHKFHGPKGVGLLWVRGGAPRIRLEPLSLGGGHEAGRRSGTLNVAGVVGMATALELAMEDLSQQQHSQRVLRERLWLGLKSELEATGVCRVELNGPQFDDRLRLPGSLNFRLEGIDGQSVMMQVPWLALSSGAACSSIKPEPSHVLRALELNDDQIRSSLRVGLSRMTTELEIDRAVQAVVQAAIQLKRMA